MGHPPRGVLGRKPASPTLSTVVGGVRPSVQSRLDPFTFTLVRTYMVAACVALFAGGRTEMCDSCGHGDYAVDADGTYCTECGQYVEDSRSNADVFDDLDEGDLIQFDGRAATKNPHVVTTPEASGGMRAVEGPGGAQKMLVQNKHNPDNIRIMSMGTMYDDSEWVNNLRVVG